MKQNSVYLSQVTYCGGYSGDEPPLTITNREVKLTSADGTAPPGGRVGRCRFSEARSRQLDRASFVVLPLVVHRKFPKTVSALQVLQPPRSPWSGGRYAPQAGTPCRFSEAPAPLKSLSVFAAANTRDRVGRLMPTSLRSTCLVSATSRIPGGAEGYFRPRQLDFCFARGAEGLFRPWQPGFCFAGGAEGFLRPWQLDFCHAKGTAVLFRPRQLDFCFAGGAEGFLCPWQLDFCVARGE